MKRFMYAAIEAILGRAVMAAKNPSGHLESLAPTPAIPVQGQPIRPFPPEAYGEGEEDQADEVVDGATEEVDEIDGDDESAQDEESTPGDEGDEEDLEQSEEDESEEETEEEEIEEPIPGLDDEEEVVDEDGQTVPIKRVHQLTRKLRESERRETVVRERAEQAEASATKWNTWWQRNGQAVQAAMNAMPNLQKELAGVKAERDALAGILEGLEQEGEFDLTQNPQMLQMTIKKAVEANMEPLRAHLQESLFSEEDRRTMAEFRASKAQNAADDLQRQQGKLFEEQWAPIQNRHPDLVKWKPHIMRSWAAGDPDTPVGAHAKEFLDLEIRTTRQRARGKKAKVPKVQKSGASRGAPKTAPVKGLADAGRRAKQRLKGADLVE